LAVDFGEEAPLVNLLDSMVAWYASRATHTKVLLALATAMLVTELLLGRFPRSAAYARWTRGVEAVGSVWTAVILSLVYGLSVGPTSLYMRLSRRDLLDRAIVPGASAWRAHEPNPLGPRAAARHQF
jgi:hypothetical protein